MLAWCIESVLAAYDSTITHFDTYVGFYLNLQQLVTGEQCSTSFWI